MVKRWKVINCHSLSIRTPSVGNGWKRNSAKLQQPWWILFFPTLITWFSTPVACIPFPWYSIFLFVFLVLLTYTCLSAPRWSPYKSSPSPCTSLSGGDLGKEMKILQRKTIFCQCVLLLCSQFWSSSLATIGKRRHLRYQILYRGIIWGWRSTWLFQHLHSLWM